MTFSNLPVTVLASALQDRHVIAETAPIRNFFHVGDDYSEDSNRGQIFKDQMYVEKLSPSLLRRLPCRPHSRTGPKLERLFSRSQIEGSPGHCSF